MASLDMARFAAEFRRLCPQASMQFEIITGRPPQVHAYLEPDFWKAYPKKPAWGIRPLRPVGEDRPPLHGLHGHRGRHPGTRPAVMDEALKEQQRVDLERSFEYARKKMNVGVRWRA